MVMLCVKVGSIGDNPLGNWYSYRASKAALNIQVKTANSELARLYLLIRLLTLLPGILISRLSQLFRGASAARPKIRATHVLLLLNDRLAPADGGDYFFRRNTPILVGKEYDLESENFDRPGCEW